MTIDKGENIIIKIADAQKFTLKRQVRKDVHYVKFK